MPSYTSSYNVCSTRAMIASQARHRSTICASKVYDYMTCPTSSERVCCTRTIMACHARPHPTICAATPYVFKLCLQSKGDDNMLYQHCLIMYAFQNDDGMPRLKFSDRVCCTGEMMPCHATCSFIASFAQW